ncbi:LolA-like outer membrane lipoprotein chaperone [Campylobacter sp. MIT 99-7217]|uniref:LolA-like outer membrane lipoprotein chaperone n=1 Tax=Campylobacter sp. MIT 99-7217 TaxID=535091 RepID=UPI00163C2652|nr:LolA-like outer membrane lipoprotein chaperone [Campylobacter sp. MIT 99-7217]
MKFLGFLLFFCVSLWGFEADYKSFSSDFTQIVSNKNSKISYKGKLIITQNKAFWSYEEPTQKQIYIKNQNITIVEPDLEQVILTKLEKVPNLTQIFKNAKQNKQGLYEANYEGVRYIVKLENDEVQSISYQDDLENEVSIILSKQKRNFAVDENIFEAKYPKSYDILR